MLRKIYVGINYKERENFPIASLYFNRLELCVFITYNIWQFFGASYF